MHSFWQPIFLGFVVGVDTLCAICSRTLASELAHISIFEDALLTRLLDWAQVVVGEVPQSRSELELTPLPQLDPCSMELKV